MDCLTGTLTVPGCWIWAGEGLPLLEQHAEPTERKKLSKDSGRTNTQERVFVDYEQAHTAELAFGIQEMPLNDGVSRETNLKPRAPFGKTPSVPVSMDSRPALTDLRDFSDSPLSK